MTDIEAEDIVPVLREMYANRMRGNGSLAIFHYHIDRSLPSLLDELEKLRAEIAFRDAPDEPLSKEEIDSIVERVVSGGEL